MEGEALERCLACEAVVSKGISLPRSIVCPCYVSCR
jgi:hypothetical protein